MLSLINTEIILQGYTTKLGIHHHNKTNQFNLSSDLMEPFRPFIDKEVYKLRNHKLNNQTKIRLINTLYQNCLIDDIQTQLYLAIPMYLKSIFNYLEDKTDKIKEITFEN